MKVYIPEQNYNVILYNNKHHDLPFHLEKDKFEIVQNVENCDIIPIMVPRPEEGYTIEKKMEFLGPQCKDKWFILMMHTHTSEGTIENFNDYHLNPWKSYTNKILIIDLNYNNKEQIPYDFCWNREKVYFTDYDKFDLTERLWSHAATKKMYSLTKIPDHSFFQMIDLKKFLIPNRWDPVNNQRFGMRGYYRKELINLANDTDCFWSDWNKDTLNLLWPEERIVNSMEELHSAFGGWWPIANRYYNRSFISVYVETIVNCDYKTWSVISEKTFDPLIKGHYILPFGYSGLIEDLKNRYGFQFPTWIDYSYDLITNTNDRFLGFLNSFEKLRKLPLSKLVEHHQREKNSILEYNRQIFYNRPYDSLHKKLVDKIKNISL